MKEQNKEIFRLMVLIAAAITVVGMVLLALRGERIAEKLLLPLVLLFVNGIFGLGVYAGINHPEWNVKYGLRRKEGRLRFARIMRTEDPEGLRYRYYGMVLPLFAALMAICLSAAPINGDYPPWATAANIVLAVAIVALMSVAEYRLKEYNTYDN